MHIRKPSEHAREAFAHLLTTYVTLTGGFRSRARLEDAVLCHESHEKVDVVAIPAFRKRFQVLNSHRHRVLHAPTKVRSSSASSGASLVNRGSTPAVGTVALWQRFCLLMLSRAMP